MNTSEMGGEIEIQNKALLPCTPEEIDKKPLLNEKGKIDGLKNARLVMEKRGNFKIQARSTIKFIFQILLGILLYATILSTIMIFKTGASSYVQALMILISMSIIGTALSIVLYLFYPVIAPRIFDFHHEVFYTKPLSFYIYLIFWDAIHIVPLSEIQAIQIIQTEKQNWRKKMQSIHQINMILKGGNRISLMIQEGFSREQTKEDAQRLATRLIVPVWDMNII